MLRSQASHPMSPSQGQSDVINSLSGEFHESNVNLDNAFNVGGNLYYQTAETGKQDRNKEVVRLDDDDGKSILKWLSSYDFVSRQKDAIKNHINKTGKWFFDSQQYHAWVEGVSRVLWCKGKPGAGKSMLMALAVKDVQQKKPSDIFVGHLFFNRDEHKNSQISTLVGNLIKQAIKMRETVPQTVTEAWSSRKDDESLPSVEVLRSMLVTELDRFSSKAIVVDGLDECAVHARRKFVHFLSEVLQACPSLRLLVSSRPMAEIGEGTFLESAPSLDIQAQSKDLSIYIDEQSKLRNGLGQSRRHPEVLKQLKDSLIRTADGIFLLVVLHINVLDSYNVATKNEFLRMLERLSSSSFGTPNKTYKAMWQQILDQDDTSSAIAQEIISWLVFSQRPMSVTEFIHALAAKYSRDGEYDTGDEYDAADIMGRCLGLVMITEQNLVQFMHPTVQDFFEEELENISEKIHATICRSCLRYLAVKSIGSCENNIELLKALKHYPFLAYAALFWNSHANSVDDRILDSVIMDFLNSSWLAARTLRVSIMLRTCDPMRFINMPSHGLSGIHLAAYTDMLPRMWALSCRMMNIRMMNIDERDSNGWTPLRWAVYGERRESLDFLIDTGTDVNAQDVDGNTTLIWALGGHHPERGIEQSRSMALNDNALVHLGDVFIVRRCVLHPSWMSPMPTRCSTTLINVLIDRSDNIDICNQGGITALMQAAKNRQFQYVQRMLRRGANINIYDDQKMNALLYALQYPRETYSYDRITTSRNAFVHFGDHIIIESSNTASTSKPLSEPIDVQDIFIKLVGENLKAKDTYGMSALALAAASGLDRVVEQLLILHRANANIIEHSQECVAALFCACSKPTTRQMRINHIDIRENARVCFGLKLEFTGEQPCVDDALEALTASYEKRIHTVEILLAHMDLTMMHSYESYQALYVAERAGYQEICDILRRTLTSPANNSLSITDLQRIKKHTSSPDYRKFQTDGFRNACFANFDYTFLNGQASLRQADLWSRSLAEDPNWFFSSAMLSSAIDAHLMCSSLQIGETSIHDDARVIAGIVYSTTPGIQDLNRPESDAWNPDVWYSEIWAINPPTRIWTRLRGFEDLDGQLDAGPPPEEDCNEPQPAFWTINEDGSRRFFKGQDDIRRAERYTLRGAPKGY